MKGAGLDRGAQPGDGVVKLAEGGGIIVGGRGMSGGMEGGDGWVYAAGNGRAGEMEGEGRGGLGGGELESADQTAMGIVGGEGKMVGMVADEMEGRINKTSAGGGVVETAGSEDGDRAVGGPSGEVREEREEGAGGGQGGGK